MLLAVANRLATLVPFLNRSQARRRRFCLARNPIDSARSVIPDGREATDRKSRLTSADPLALRIPGQTFGLPRLTMRRVSHSSKTVSLVAVRGRQRHPQAGMIV